MDKLIIGKPGESEYASYFSRYVNLVDSDDILKSLVTQMADTNSVLREISEDKGAFSYAEGKWSIKELVGHLIDTERVMAYRAMRFSRKDETELEGFEQDPYVSNGNFNNVNLAGLVKQFALLRESNLYMFQGLSEEAWSFKGMASGFPISVRTLAYIIAGHELHHMKILEERYLV